MARHITKKQKKLADSSVPKQNRYMVRIDHEKFDSILEFYQAGESLHSISQMEGMPSYGGLLHAVAVNPEWAERLATVKKIRALHFEEEAHKVLQEVEDKTSRDRAAVGKLKLDGYLRLAEICSPETYGRRTTVGGDPTRPIQIHVSTGVPAPLAHQTPPSLDSSGAIVATSTTIVEDEEHS